MKKLLGILVTLLVMISASAAPNVPDSLMIPDELGAIVRLKADTPTVYLLFSADSTFDGGEVILETLDRYGLKGNFFFTGNFLRMPEHNDIFIRILKEGHYIGSHSNGHLQYADWDANHTSLVTPDSLKNDLKESYAELAKAGADTARARWFLPPYEWYGAEHIEAIRSMGLTPVNVTPGVVLPYDYTTPDMKDYKTSDEILQRFYAFGERRGLDGAMLLVHPGTNPMRTDKLYNRLDEIIEFVQKKGYRISLLP